MLLRMENLNFANMTFPAVAMVDGDSDQLFNAWTLLRFLLKFIEILSNRTRRYSIIVPAVTDHVMPTAAGN